DDGSFIYTPDDGFSGKDSFVYEISDATGLKAKATVTITVTRPRLSVSKRSLAISSAGPSAFFIPGNQVAYEIEVENSGNQEVDANTLFIVDSWPADVSFAADQSVTWEDSASGLDFNQSRDVGYSDSAIKPASLDQCTYDPAPGYDPAVRFICINPQGALSPDGSARFSMRGRIN
ncbi:MAG: cadherin-like domain-containing protein, partial [Pseudomonadota bacterium]